MQQVRGAGCAGKFQISIDHVGRVGFDRGRIEECGRLFADLRSMKSDDPIRFGRRRHERGLDEALKVDGEIKRLFAKFSPRAEDAAQSAVKGNHFVDEWIAFE